MNRTPEPQRMALHQAGRAGAGRPAVDGGHRIDELFLIHTYINNFYEIFEEYADEEALALLQQIERECC